MKLHSAVVSNANIPRKHESLSIHEGVYCAEDARVQILEMISNNIRFHGVRSLSNEEVLGIKDEYSENKIIELKESKQTIQSLLDYATKEGMDVTIESNVIVSIG